jgi:hypothetical protein
MRVITRLSQHCGCPCRRDRIKLASDRLDIKGVIFDPALNTRFVGLEMLSEKSPYVVTLLVALITWVATEYYEITSRAGFISIDTSKVESDDGHDWTLTVKNLSKWVTIRNIDLSVQCDEQPCFKKRGNGGYAEDTHVPPLMVEFVRQYETASIGINQVNMPPKSAFRVRFTTSGNIDRVSSLMLTCSPIFGAFGTGIFQL